MISQIIATLLAHCYIKTFKINTQPINFIPFPSTYNNWMKNNGDTHHELHFMQFFHDCFPLSILPTLLNYAENVLSPWYK